MRKHFPSSCSPSHPKSRWKIYFQHTVQVLSEIGNAFTLAAGMPAMATQSCVKPTTSGSCDMNVGGSTSGSVTPPPAGDSVNVHGTQQVLSHHLLSHSCHFYCPWSQCPIQANGPKDTSLLNQHRILPSCISLLKPGSRLKIVDEDKALLAFRYTAQNRPADPSSLACVEVPLRPTKQNYLSQTLTHFEGERFLQKWTDPFLCFNVTVC